MAQIAPIWLDMRTEYIDANFDKFVEYLYQNRAQNTDTFYLTSVELLRRRVDELVGGIASVPLFRQESVDDDSERQASLFAIRLLGVYLLIDDPGHGALRRRAFVYQLLQLCRICSPERVESLLEFAMKVLVSGTDFILGYAWNDIQTLYPDILVSMVLQYAHSGKSQNKERQFVANGIATMANGSMRVMAHSDKSGNMQVSMSAFDGHLQIMSPQGSKLKKGQQDDIVAVRAFTNDYLHSMDSSNKLSDVHKLKPWFPDPDAQVEIRIESVAGGKAVAVTVDKAHKPLRGCVKLQNVLGYTQLDVLHYFKEGDLMPARITDINEEGMAVFDITAELVDFIAKDYIKPGYDVSAVAVMNNNDHTMWATDLGAPVYTRWKHFDLGTIAKLTIEEVGSNGYITANFEELLDQPSVDTDTPKKDCMHSFCYEPEPDSGDANADSDEFVIDRSDLMAAARCLFVQQRMESDPAEHYRLLCMLQILCGLTSDTVSGAYVSFMAQYLNNLVLFAKGEYDAMFTPQVEECISREPAVLRRQRILDALCGYGHDDRDDILESIEASDDQQVSRLAMLVRSCNRLRGVLSGPMQNAIVHEILSMLKMDDYIETDLEEEGGVYLGIENGHQEFKTSFVYPPDNQMQPDTRQQKLNVFKAVCAFLNSESGGVIYLGVNDLGHIVGVDNDLRFLKVTLDGYMRHITDEAKAEFGLGVLTYLDIQAMYDDRVVAITVKPCDYTVVELAGKAYIRTNAENREMTKAVRLRIQEKKRTFNKEKEQTLADLQRAISYRRKVVVRGYSSSHGGDRRDRNLEPFAFTNGQTHVWCYDLDARMVKIFSVSRITNVEILEQEWTETANHKEGNIDIFHMTGPETKRITLELNRMAYNLIIEEYPDSKRFLSAAPGDKWILDTPICSVYGVGRFYVGLADNITILDAPELAAYARDYFARQVASNS